jgi:hypothetical protein
MSLALLLLFVLGALSVSPPTWPKQYRATGTLSLPYGYGITQPLQYSYDAINSRVRVDYFGGMDQYYYRFDLQKTFMVVPRIDELACFATDTPPTSDPLPTVLPDLTGWQYTGIVTENSRSFESWQTSTTILGYTSNHTMLLYTGSQRPYRLTMQGYDFLFGSHPDVYILDYSSFMPVAIPSDFQVPDLCQKAKPSLRRAARANAMLGIFSSLVAPPSDEFEAFKSQHKKSYSVEEKSSRFQTWKMNQKKIAVHNMDSKKHGFTLKSNHFSDMSQEEFNFLMLPNSKIHRPSFQSRHVHPEPTPEQIAALPASIDWRTKKRSYHG